jgi:hypothetical protein
VLPWLQWRVSPCSTGRKAERVYAREQGADIGYGWLVCGHFADKRSEALDGRADSVKLAVEAWSTAQLGGWRARSPNVV